MGKAARERARRKAEAEAPPELIVVEDPTPKAPPTTDPADDRPVCMVKGCDNTALLVEVHNGPNGPVRLCPSCGRIARRNLAEERRRQELAEEVARILRPEPDVKGPVEPVLLG